MSAVSFLGHLKRFGIVYFSILLSIPLTGRSCLAEAVYVVRGKNGSTIYTNRPRPNEAILRVVHPNAGRLSKVPSSSFYSVNKFSKSKNAYKFDELIKRHARQRGLDPSLVKAVVHAESAFNPTARSPKGAMGLMQLMPATARLVGVRDPYEPAENIRGGVYYLAKMLRRYNGDIRLSLAAYNAGPLAVDTYRGIPPYRETQEYVRKVLALHQVYR